MHTMVRASVQEVSLRAVDKSSLGSLVYNINHSHRYTPEII